MNGKIKEVLCIVAAIAAVVWVADEFATMRNSEAKEAQEVRVDLHMVDEVIPCAVVSQGGVPMAMSCKWDHVNVTTDDDEEDAEPEPARWVL